MSTHSGTHMDGLSHVDDDGVLFDGTRILEPGVQDERSGMRLRTLENLSRRTEFLFMAAQLFCVGVRARRSICLHSV
jgi:hypothetical protein